jgi:voltage-gated potassium channel
MRPSSGSEHGGGETQSNNTMATTDDAPHAPMERLTARRRRWLVMLGLLRALATAVILVALYYVLPLDRRSDTYVLAEIAIGVALLTGVIVWELRAIIRSRYPAIRATQALATTTPLFLLFFASMYFIMGLDDVAAFTEPLSRSDALYFTVTVFSTVGFGDISAQTETGRLVVTAQMLLDLVILGLGIQVILGAVKRGKASPDEAES